MTQGNVLRARRVAQGLAPYSDVELEGNRLRRQRQRQVILERVNLIKIERGCADCGYNEHACALDFDHLPEFDKVSNVSSLIRTCGWKRVEEEIAKCEVVCANCHRVRTAERLSGVGAFATAERATP